MLYVQLDTNWPDHPKIIDAGIEGAGLHAIALCLAKRLEEDGWVNRRLLHRQGATDDLIDRLVGLRLLEEDGVRVRPWGWHDRNPSQAAIAARRASKVDAGRRGNHTKHGHGGPYEKCPICAPQPLVVAGCEPVRSQPLAVDDECGPVATKAEVTTEVTPAIAAVPNRLAQRAAEIGGIAS